jgi:hypothetical protein
MQDEVYFAPAKSFNDPFDLRPHFSLEAPIRRQWRDFERMSRKFEPHLTARERRASARRVIETSLSSTDIGTTQTAIKIAASHALTNQLGCGILARQPAHVGALRRLPSWHLLGVRSRRPDVRTGPGSRLLSGAQCHQPVCRFSRRASDEGSADEISSLGLRGRVASHPDGWSRSGPHSKHGARRDRHRCGGKRSDNLRGPGVGARKECAAPAASRGPRSEALSAQSRTTEAELVIARLRAGSIERSFRSLLDRLHFAPRPAAHTAEQPGAQPRSQGARMGATVPRWRLH